MDGQSVTARVGDGPIGTVDANGDAEGQGVLGREEVPDVLGDESLEVLIVGGFVAGPNRLRGDQGHEAVGQLRRVRRPAAVAGEPGIEVLGSAAAAFACDMRSHKQRSARHANGGQPDLRPVMRRGLVNVDVEQVT